MDRRTLVLLVGAVIVVAGAAVVVWPATTGACDGTLAESTAGEPFLVVSNEDATERRLSITVAHANGTTLSEATYCLDANERGTVGLGTLDAGTQVTITASLEGTTPLSADIVVGLDDRTEPLVIVSDGSVRVIQGIE